MIASKELGSGEIAATRLCAVGSIKEACERYTHLGNVLRVLGYDQQQIQELQETINPAPRDAMIVGAPDHANTRFKIAGPYITTKPTEV